MSDVPDRSTSITTTPTVSSPPLEARREEAYRPLSLLAISGFTLALLYAFLVILGGLAPLAERYRAMLFIILVGTGVTGGIVGLLGKRGLSGSLGYAGLSLAGLATVLGLGGLIAFSGTYPWLILQGWGWGLILLALSLCWMAQSQIQASEGTLGGASLARWGLGLGLFFSLYYGTYLLGSTFAVRNQARGCAEEFLSELQKKDDPEKLMRAFLLTLPPNSRPSSDIRRSIEIVHNSGGERTNPGQFTQFTIQPYVRMMLPGVQDVQFQRVEQSAFERGAYKVDLIYRIEGGLGAFNLVVRVEGQEKIEGGATRRLWHVVRDGTGYLPPTISTTDLGHAYEMCTPRARFIAAEWAMKLRLRQVVSAYMDTMPPSERRKALGSALLREPGFMGLAGIALAGGLGTNTEALAAFDKGLETYRSAVILDTSDLWVANESTKKPMIEDVKHLIAATGSPQSDALLIETAKLPTVQGHGDRAEFSFPINLVTWAPGGQKPQFQFEGELVVTGPLKTDPPLTSPYHITKLRLLRGQTARDPAKQQ